MRYIGPSSLYMPSWTAPIESRPPRARKSGSVPTTGHFGGMGRAARLARGSLEGSGDPPPPPPNASKTSRRKAGRFAPKSGVGVRATGAASVRADEATEGSARAGPALALKAAVRGTPSARRASTAVDLKHNMVAMVQATATSNVNDFVMWVVGSPSKNKLDP